MMDMTSETKTERSKSAKRGKRKMVDFAPKTDESLLRRLDEAAKAGLTKAEVYQQRVSFVFGNLPNDSTLTRQQVAEELAKAEGEQSAA